MTADLEDRSAWHGGGAGRAQHCQRRLPNLRPAFPRGRTRNSNSGRRAQRAREPKGQAGRCNVRCEEYRLRRERECSRRAGSPASRSYPIGLEPDEGRAGAPGRGWFRKLHPDWARDRGADYRRPSCKFGGIHRHGLGIPRLDSLFEGHAKEAGYAYRGRPGADERRQGDVN